MIYKVLKVVFRFTIHKYFKEITILNADRIPKDKPVILLPNHRSAFMDPLVIACSIKPTTYFLARGESFRNKFMVKIFKALKMIPIFRKEYDPDKVQENEKIFEHCYDLLESNGVLMIFPEGLCQTRFTLSPLKTGAARIALGAEEKNNFNLGLNLIPVGISYTNPHRFRGRLTLDFAEPIDLSEYKTSYHENPKGAVNDLTDQIFKSLSSKIIMIDDKNDDVLFKNLDLIFRNNEEKSNSWVEHKKDLVTKFKKLRDKSQEEYLSLVERVQNYVNTSNEIKIPQTKSATSLVPLTLFLLFGLPLYIVGFSFHFIPFYLTTHLALKLVKRSDFMGSVLVLLGLVIFSIFGFTSAFLIYKVYGVIWISIVFLLFYAPLGLYTYGYTRKLKEWLDRIKWLRLQREDAFAAEYLTNEKRIIKDILDQY